jgi:O-antigen/teichoic acid export membrane protein
MLTKFVRNLINASAIDQRVNGDRSPSTNCFSKARQLLHLALFSHGVLALCDQAVISLGNFLTGVVLGRLAGKEQLGLYALCWTIVCTTIDLSGALTTTPYTVFSPHLRRFQRRSYIGNMFLLHCVISVTAAVLLAAASLLYTSERSAVGMLRVLLTTAAVLVLLNAREFARRICFADLAIGFALILDTVFLALHVAGLMMLWRNEALAASAVYLLLGIIALVQTTTWCFVYRAKIKVTKEWWSEGLRNWHFSKWVLGSGLLWTLATYLYPWLLAAYHGTMSAGVWASCSAVVAVGNPVLGGLINYLGPRLSTLYAREGHAAMRTYVYRSSVLLVLMLSPFALALSFWGGRIMSALYGPAYADTQPILILLSLNLLALSFTQPYSRGLFALQSAKIDMVVNLAALVLLFTCGVIAVKFYSLTGAAFALLLSTTITAAMRFAAFAKATGPISPSETLQPSQWVAAASDV